MTLRCRAARHDDINAMALIAAHGFEEYPLHGMMRPFMKPGASYFDFLVDLNTTMVRAYLRWRNALVVEQDGVAVAIALLNRVPVGLAGYIANGGLSMLRSASLASLLRFFAMTEEADRGAKENADYDWYLEILAVAPGKRGHGIGSWVMRDVLPAYVRRRGGHRIAFITCTEDNVRFYRNSGCRVVNEDQVSLGGRTCPVWAFEKVAFEKVAHTD